MHKNSTKTRNKLAKLAGTPKSFNACKKTKAWSLKCSKKHTLSNLAKKFGYKKGSKNEPKGGKERRRSALLYTPKGTHLLSFVYGKFIT